MQLKFRIIFVSLLLISLVSRGQQEGDLILQSKISIRQIDQLVSTVLDSISKQTGYFFSYDPVQVQANRKVSISFSNASIEKVLNAIFKEKLSYKVLRNQIIIYKEIEQTGEEETPAEAKEPIIMLSGKIIDLDNNAPIPYASVSIWKKTIGTMSNIDGEFELKIPNEIKNDTLIFSCMGYQKYLLPIRDFEFEKNSIFLRPVSIRIKEIKVKAIAALDIINEMLEKISTNYPTEPYLMTTFYRETLQQDEKYMNVSEAVMEILKTSYSNTYREDRTRLIKGRKNNQERLFKWVDFKMQGGPYYITFLDVIKTKESFLDKDLMTLYKYEIEEVIFYRERPTYVISFKPKIRSDQSMYHGRLYVDRETSALVQTDFGLDKSGLRIAKESMIKKKPKGFNVRPENVSYKVTYKSDNGKWYFNTAWALVQFKVRSRDDKINSLYTSISDLLITEYEKTDVKRFKSSETFHSDDIFTEIIVNYDEEFWGKYNTIKPNEDLRKAIRPEKDIK